MSEETRIPILKKEEVVSTEISYNELGSIAQALFIIGGNWKKHYPEKLEQFKKEVDEKIPFSDIEFSTFMYLDLLYKKTIKQAENEGKCNYRTIEEALSPLFSNPL